MENTLIHDGRKGMQWGKHIFVDNPSAYKNGAEAGSKLASAAKSSHTAKVEQQVKKKIKKETKYMTDEELKQKVGRMNLEEQYVKLSAARVSAGKDQVSKFLGATTTVLNVAASALTVAVAIKQLNALSTAAKVVS